MSVFTLHVRNNQEVTVHTGIEKRNGWRDPIGGSRLIKTLKMLVAVGGLFLVSFFTFIVTLNIICG